MIAFRLPLAATLALVALSAAHAAPHGRTAFVADYDLNKDDKVTAEEFKTVRDARFAATDTSKDGGMDEAEYVGEYAARLDVQLAASKATDAEKAKERDGQLKQAHVRFNVLDKNKDKKIDPEEYAASGTRAFAEQDGDHDGVVTQEEKKSSEPS